MDNFNECTYNILLFIKRYKFYKKKFVRWIKIAYKYMFLLLFYVISDSFKIMIPWTNKTKQN